MDKSYLCFQEAERVFRQGDVPISLENLLPSDDIPIWPSISRCLLVRDYGRSMSIVIDAYLRMILSKALNEEIS